MGATLTNLPDTCFFSLELPKYTNEDSMRNKFLYAIKNCLSIDTGSVCELLSECRPHCCTPDYAAQNVNWDAE